MGREVRVCVGCRECVETIYVEREREGKRQIERENEGETKRERRRERESE